jgi:phosphoribosylformimino-5-aminoimidazole carboxamide ribotide isomerase
MGVRSFGQQNAKDGPVLVIPAIDIKNGRCVRLKQGQMSQETVYSDSPVEMALHWFENGAERLHLVDLDGAVEGRPVNQELIRDMVRAIPIPVQLGGGIRNMKTIEAYLELGVQWVILGTVAYKNVAFVELACKTFPGRIILGIDAKENRVAVEGWTEETSVTALEMARRFESLELAAIVYTDIQRDGMSIGPNIRATEDLARNARVAVIASGGISGLHDVARLLPLAQYGVIGMITGRALYEGRLDLREAIKLSKEKKSEKSS